MRLGPLVPLTACALVSGCAVGQPSTFSLTGAGVDATHVCAVGSSDTPYTLHATVDVSNRTSGTVTIRSVSATLTLKSVKGTWLEPVGERYSATEVQYAPQTIAADTTRTLTLSIPSSCTDPRPGAQGASYGEYAVEISLATSAGTFDVGAHGLHRIVAG